MCITCGCGTDETKFDGKVLPHSHDHGGGTGHEHSHVHPHAHQQGTARFGISPTKAHTHGSEQTRRVKVERDILSMNNTYAQENRSYFIKHGIFALNLVS